MHKLLAWLKSHRIAVLFILLVVMGFAGVRFANWQAERRWRRYCEDGRARGVKIRIAKGAFPDKLDELAPDFIEAVPRDIYSGKMMIYRRKGTGSFLLYSVGQNRIDDQGIIDPKKTERRQIDDVWLFAPAGAP